jgi:hypothetical protein
MTYAATFDPFQYDSVSKQHDEEAKMSNTRIFDTLQYANKLKAVGVPEKQAEVQAEAMLEIIEDKLANKKDLEQVRSDLKKDIEQVNSELKRDIEQVRFELKHDIKAMGYKTIIALAVILPTITSILEYLTRLRG